MADIFLSYARQDAAAAGRVARELAKHGWSIWFDQELRAHESLADVIAKELEEARAVLVLWSPAAVESHWVRSEANRARELHKLVQAQLGPVRLPMPFDQIHCADLGKWRSARSAGWTQVLRSLSELAEKPSGPSRPVEGGNANRRNVLIGAGAAVIAAVGLAGW